MEPRKKLKWEYASQQETEACTDKARWLIERGYVAKRIYYAEDDDDATA
jgi:hypothetical protein